jgi:hypothetical protein
MDINIDDFVSVNGPEVTFWTADGEPETVYLDSGRLAKAVAEAVANTLRTW